MRSDHQSHLPKYGFHKASGQARVLLSGREVYLGVHDSAESYEKYDRLIAEYLAEGHAIYFTPC
ncbi:MAG: hypothetical protein Phyf2KO_00790 [Phycisphaerales bacterium]